MELDFALPCTPSRDKMALPSFELAMPWKEALFDMDFAALPCTPCWDRLRLPTFDPVDKLTFLIGDGPILQPPTRNWIQHGNFA